MPETREVLRRDADAIVRDRDLRRAAVGPDRDANLTPRRGVLHRIADQVHEELLDARLIALHRQARGSAHRETVTAFLGGRCDVSQDDLARDRGEVERNALHVQLAALGA